jgi:adenine-specific DNA-methyltransferase
MADELDGLLARVDDPDLRADLRAQIDRIRAKRTFGLVFESHLPERVRLPDHPIRAGASVAVRDDNASATYQVLAVRQGTATVRRIRVADGSRLSAEELASSDDEEHPLEDLVVVADFGQPIYPGIRTLGSIERGGDKPAHVVIKGENHHVLEALQFTHAGKVDCIYIDPPYNTGARDWKYDNRYVDDTDAYRHSKWLAFMERRLLLAKELLNSERSVLIVTIDEKEYLRLGLLLEQLFPEARHQMLSIAINPAGVARKGGFSRSDEYAFVVSFGDAVPARQELGAEWVSTKGRTFTGNVRWDLLRRSGTNSTRQDRPNMFYPVYIDPAGPRISEVGEPLPLGESSTPERRGVVGLLPIRKDGTEGNWQLSPAELRARVAQGRVRIGGNQTKGFVLYYLKQAEYQKVVDGTYPVEGTAPDGSLVLGRSEASGVVTVPTTQWRIPSHDSTQYGSRLLSNLIPDRKFPFPKSLYAVEDSLRFFCNDPDAVVVDFFGGSGTTAHAVARLNHQDGGRRQSIVITNNEVSAAEADSLRKRGFRPGDPEWEALGIFEHVTRPRITSAVTGVTPDGDPVKGDYRFTDEFPMAEGLEENVTFAELVYLDPDDVELGLAFAAVAPLLWLRAGAQGPIIEECLDSAGRRKPYAWTERYGVLFNPDRWRSFVEKMPTSATTAFVVTDSQAIFAGVTAELPDHLEVVRLYENYLTTFRINEGLG